MLRTAIPVCCLILPLAAQTPTITSVTSAANAKTGIAGDSLATIMGMGLAAQTASAKAVPWPTTDGLGGVTVWMIDSQQTRRPAGLIYVSPAQINFQVPPGTAVGAATVTVGAISTTVQVQAVAPALFAIDDASIAAASGIRMVIATRMQSPVTVFQCAASTPQICRPMPIDVGVDAPVYLSFYGTGIRNRSSLDKVTVTIGTTTVQAMYAGPQPDTPGLDQVNVPLPLSLRGAGEVNVTVTVDGVTSNAVKISIM